MAKLTEIEGESEAEKVRGVRSSRNSSKPEVLTQTQREQTLFESGVWGKLGLPHDFVTLEEAQAQLEAQGTAASSPTSIGKEHSAKRLAKDKTSGNAQVDVAAELDTDSDEDRYGNDSEADYDAADDTAEALMREQEANEMHPRLESSLDLLIWTMPFGFLYTLLDVLVRQQYGETIGFLDEGKRLGRSVPGESV